MHNTGDLIAEVAYAAPDEQALVCVKVPVGTSVRGAIDASGLLQRFTDIDLERQAVGIFGKICELTQPVQAHDRIEIYRPLINDPKDARRRRAEKNR